MRMLLLLSPLLLAACVSAPKDPFAPAPGNPAWPLPPELPRIEYITSIREKSDLIHSRSLWATIVRYTVGEEDTLMVRPYAVSIHPAGGLLVTDPGLGVVHFHDLERRRYHQLGKDLDGGLPSPVGVAVAGDGTILVSDSRRRTVERFGTGGSHMGTFASGHSFQRPGGLAVHPATGDVHVLDILGHEVVVFTADGRFVRRFGGNGDQPGMFNFPTHAAFTPAGELLVADSMNFRIQKFDPAGEWKASFGDPGNARGNFARPKGVSGIDDEVHAAMEGLFDSLIFFNSRGELLLTVGEPGSGPGQFWLPAGLTVDHDKGLVFVADTYNSRVQVFRMIPHNAAEGPAGRERESQP